jgi:hypothetical protein
MRARARPARDAGAAGGLRICRGQIGRGWSKTAAPISFEVDDTYGQFADIHLCESGIVR